MYYYSTTFSGGPGVSAHVAYTSFPLPTNVLVPSPPSASLTPIDSPIFVHVRPTFSGGFDIPNAKCPPDRGSSDWVTDSLAPSSFPPLSSSPAPSFVSSNDSAASTHSSIGSDPHPCLSTHFSVPPYALPPTPPPEDSPFGAEFPLAALPSASAPRAIPDAHAHAHRFGAGGGAGLATPPLTPDDGAGSLAALGAKQSAFLSVLFPRNALGAAPHARSVAISTPGTGATFDGVVLSLPDKPKTFYVDGKCAANVNLRERCVPGSGMRWALCAVLTGPCLLSIVALLDLADEQLGCNALVIALERSSPALGDLLHSLMYVGGTVVTKPPFPTDPAYVLVGMEI